MSSESAPARSEPPGADPVSTTDRPRSGVTGRTRVAAVIGDPVEHSRSPRILNAAFAATGVDFISVGALTHSATAVDLALDLETLPAS